jgi:hypothetical protein
MVGWIKIYQQLSVESFLIIERQVKRSSFLFCIMRSTSSTLAFVKRSNTSSKGIAEKSTGRLQVAVTTPLFRRLLKQG